VIGAAFTVGLAKTKGDFRVAIAIASVISCAANAKSGITSACPFFDRCAGISHRAREESISTISSSHMPATSPARAAVRSAIFNARPTRGDTGGWTRSGAEERDFFVGQNSAATIFDATLRQPMARVDAQEACIDSKCKDFGNKRLHAICVGLSASRDHAFA
jgi:hypothetical protein